MPAFPIIHIYKHPDEYGWHATKCLSCSLQQHRVNVLNVGMHAYVNICVNDGSLIVLFTDMVAYKDIVGFCDL